MYLVDKLNLPAYGRKLPQMMCSAAVWGRITEAGSAAPASLFSIRELRQICNFGIYFTKIMLEPPNGVADRVASPRSTADIVPAQYPPKVSEGGRVKGKVPVGGRVKGIS